MWSLIEEAKFGGNKKFCCQYCGAVRIGSYTKCKFVTDEILQEHRREHRDVERKKANMAIQSKQKTYYMSLPQGALELSFSAIDKDRVDKECARAFYTSAIPFNFLATTNLADYVPPTFDRLQMTLLIQERTHVDGFLLLIRDTWRKRGTSICLDRWSGL
ncbi:hypothetical protein CXB51_019254 [Gossypium anomalum]|uniref:Uncharacterized protein n=1 Tax=Gossypium anomalum TaxID=47600 RepID=A0A8J5Y9Z0_9ROSI|nr:hypothetical protein CXB51_019254 [Gossypium anomalum]